MRICCSRRNMVKQQSAVLIHQKKEGLLPSRGEIPTQTSDEFLESGKELPNIAVMLGLLHLASKHIGRGTQGSISEGNLLYIKYFSGKNGEREKKNTVCRYWMPSCGPANWVSLSLNSRTTISGTFIKHFIYLVELQAPGFLQNPTPFRKHSYFLLIDVLEDPTDGKITSTILCWNTNYIQNLTLCCIPSVLRILLSGCQLGLPRLNSQDFSKQVISKHDQDPTWAS